MLATTLFTFQLDLYSLLSALLYFCCFEDKWLFCLLIERNFVSTERCGRIYRRTFTKHLGSPSKLLINPTYKDVFYYKIFVK